MTDWSLLLQNVLALLRRPGPAILTLALVVLVASQLVIRHSSETDWTTRLGMNRSQPKLKVQWYTVGLGQGYLNFALNFVESAEKHFCRKYRHLVDVEYVIYTNHEVDPIKYPSVIAIQEKKRGWPDDSALRFQFMTDHAEETGLLGADYALWTDADQAFVDDACFELLGESTALTHAGLYGTTNNYPYEGRPESQAFVPQENRHKQPYFSAHFFGFTGRGLFDMALQTAKATRIDTENGIQAAVDDESHLNHWFYVHPPTNIISPAFVYPEKGHVEGFRPIIQAVCTDCEGGKPRTGD